MVLHFLVLTQTGLCMPIIFPTLNHPLRVSLAAEIHSRPPIRLEVPERITQMAVHGRNEPSSGRLGVQTELLASLCVQFGVTPPADEARYFFHDFGRFRLKWECHTEFASYTFVAGMRTPRSPDNLFGQMPSADLPEAWLLRLQGLLMVATHIVLEKASESAAEAVPHMRRLFEGNPVVGCEASEAAQV